MPNTNQPNAGDTKMGQNKEHLPSSRKIPANRQHWPGRKYTSSTRCYTGMCSTDIRALAAQSVAVMWETVRTSEKWRKTAFGIQRPTAFFSMPFSPHLKSKWFKACVELKENLHAQIILLLLPGVEPFWHDSSTRRQSPSPLEHWGLIFWADSGG